MERATARERWGSEPPRESLSHRALARWPFALLLRARSLGAGDEGAFRAVRKAALRDELALDGDELEDFVERGERITSAVQEADDRFYSCVFAPGGSSQIGGIFDKARGSVDRALGDFMVVLELLAAAEGAAPAAAQGPASVSAAAAGE